MGLLEGQLGCTGIILYHGFETLLPKVVIEDEIVLEVMERRRRPGIGRICTDLFHDCHCSYSRIGGIRNIIKRLL